MFRYRYRTNALIGPWRKSRVIALADAIRAKQAFWDDHSGRVSWRVPGSIEKEPEAREQGDSRGTEFTLDRSRRPRNNA